MYIGLHVKYPLFLSDFIGTSIFLTDFLSPLISNLMKIHPVVAELFHVDVRHDRANSHFL